MSLRAGLVCVWVAAMGLGACGDNDKATVSIERDSMRIPVGASQKDKLVVEGYAPAGAVRTWTQSDPRVAMLQEDGEQLIVTGMKPGTTDVHFRYGAVTQDIAVEVTDAAPNALRIEPTGMTLPLGASSQIAAIVTYSDGTELDVSDQAAWHMADRDIANYDTNSVHAQLAGSTILSVHFENFDAQSNITVSNASVTRIELDPPSLTLPIGIHSQITAVGFFSDGTVHDVTAIADWTSDADATATVSRGDVAGVAAGTTQIRAAIGDAKAATATTVINANLLALSVDPAIAALPVGFKLQLVATGHFDNGTAYDLSKQATWAADAHATVDLKGLATGTSPGTAHVTATFGSQTGNATLTISSALISRIDMSDATLTMPIATQHKLTATAVFSDNTTLDVTNQATWAAADAAIATVAQGLVTATMTGSTDISAKLATATGHTALTVSGTPIASIDVSPATQTMPLLTHLPFIATAHFMDGTSADISQAATWSSDNILVALVSNADGSRGHVTALLVGDAHITAKFGALSGTAAVHVSIAVATQLQVTPATSSVAVGGTQQFTATAVYSDNSTLDVTHTVVWGTLLSTKASISNAEGSQGLATGLTAGTSGITATYGLLTATAQLTVTAATLTKLEIEPATVSLSLLATKQLSAMATYSDNSVVDVTAQCTWSTSAALSATVTNGLLSRGLVTGLLPGSVTITAAFGTQSATAAVTVTPAQLTSISATPNPLITQKGNTKQLAVQALYTDLSTSDFTASASYVSSAPQTATVSPSGLVTAVAAGLATITVTANGQMTTVLVTVTPAILVNLTVLGGDVSLPAGLHVPVIVLGHYSDGTTADITPNVTFTTGNASIASVSNVAANIGDLSANAQGQTTLTAHVGDLSATVNVNITGAQLQSIDVSAIAGNLLLAQVQAFTATGHYSDGSTQDLTNLVSFNSSNPGVLTISNLLGSAGTGIALGLGSTNVTATLLGITGSTTVNVGQGCHVVINEVTMGSLTNSKNEFIELYNPCTVEFGLQGQTLVYRTALGSTDTVLVNLTGTSIGAGQYLVYANSGFTGTKQGAFTTDLDGLGGAIALRSSSTTVVDSVGYGVAINQYVEGVGAVLGILGQSIARKPNGTDTNNNLTDFAVLTTPTPGAAN